MWTRQFWLDAAERAVKTFAQTFLAVVGGGATVASVGWKQNLTAAGFAAALSLLTSVGSAKVGTPGTASLLPNEPTP